MSEVFEDVLLWDKNIYNLFVVFLLPTPKAWKSFTIKSKTFSVNKKPQKTLEIFVLVFGGIPQDCWSVILSSAATEMALAAWAVIFSLKLRTIQGA